MPAPHWPPSRAARRTGHRAAAERLAAVRAAAGNGWVPEPPPDPAAPDDTAPRVDPPEPDPPEPDPPADAPPGPPTDDPWEIVVGGPGVDAPTAGGDPDPDPPVRLQARDRRRRPAAGDLRGRDSWRHRVADRTPVPLRGARWSVPAAAAAALLALTGVVGVAVVVRTAEATPGVPVPARPPAATDEAVGADAGPAGGADPANGVAAGAPPTATVATPDAAQRPGEVVVHVTGRVTAPGLVRLPGGARVDDAVRAVGGTTAEADLTAVNLARPLVDGEQVHVPAPGEAPPATAGPGAASPPGPGPGGGAAPALVDLNTASLADLDGLPGIGPVLAQRILDWRTQNGRFSSVDELGEVSGIGDAVLARLRPLVRV